MPRILVVDDDARVLAALTRTLRGDGHDVHAVPSAERALGEIARFAPEVVLSDVRMKGMDGLDFLRLVRERAPDVPVVLMTAYGALPTVAEAMRDGAADFLLKPLDVAQLRSVLAAVLADRRTPTPAGPRREDAVGLPLVGRDPRMLEIFKTVGQVAATRATVVIRGESGTGKELVARAIHDASPWASEPFVAVNCTAVPPTLLESELFGHVKGAFTGASADRRGRFALAGRGTLFLDEIGDTTLDFQSKLLRVLQEREFLPVGAERSERTEARVIAATHRDLEGLVAREEFREDLYYRLRVVEIELPPLRERPGDIPPLAEHLVAKASRGIGREPPALAPEALEAILGHAWPGNVRELENCLTRAVVLATGDVIRPAHLAIDRGSVAARTAGRSLDAAIRDHVAAVLESTGGGKAAAARILRVSRPRLDRLIDKYGIPLPARGEE